MISTRNRSKDNDIHIMVCMCIDAHGHVDVHIVHTFMFYNDFSQQVFLFLQPLFLAISRILLFTEHSEESVSNVGIRCSVNMNAASCDSLKSEYLNVLFLGRSATI